MKLLVQIVALALCSTTAASQSVLQLATRPLDYAPRNAPTDVCNFSPCPAATVTLDALTGGISPGRQWPMNARVSVAVINLNPFRFSNVVTLEAKPWRPDAPGDFLQPPYIPAPAPPPPPPSPPPPPALAPCTIPESVRVRLRSMARDMREARLALDRWSRDSVAQPRNQVADRRIELESVLWSDRRTSRELYSAAWQLHELAKTFLPALRNSGLLDSSRVVPPYVFHQAFQREVDAIGQCSDNELTTWQTESYLALGSLSTARREVGASENFLRTFQATDRSVWSIGSTPRNFYEERSTGQFAEPMNVFVLLFRDFRNDPTPPRARTRDRAYAGWTLIFK